MNTVTYDPVLVSMVTVDVLISTDISVYIYVYLCLCTLDTYIDILVLRTFRTKELSITIAIFFKYSESSRILKYVQGNLSKIVPKVC